MGSPCVQLGCVVAVFWWYGHLGVHSECWQLSQGFWSCQSSL